MVDAVGGDVTAAVKGWLVDTGRMHPAAEIVYLEIRAWKENLSGPSTAARDRIVARRTEIISSAGAGPARARRECW